MSSILAQFDGLKYAGKTTLILEAAKLLFKKGYSVTIIPEWRTTDYGPQDMFSWINYTCEERVHANRIARESVSDFILSDRGFLSLRAFCESRSSSFPLQWSQKINQLMVEADSTNDIYFFITADRETIKDRAMFRDNTSQNIDSLQLNYIYMELYQSLNAKPLVIDTTALSPEIGAKIICETLIEYKNNMKGA